ncbi:hypothetical protein [Nostoc sp.]|uniref:hypothetical protein n=1 Tax=Nostoc sp. TaxID=1180 RepID=UPI002FFA04DA
MKILSAIAHSSTTGDRFIFEIFCKAISTTGYAYAFRNVQSAIAFGNVRSAIAFLKFSERRSLLGMCKVRSLTLPQQAIALFLRFSVRRYLR